MRLRYDLSESQGVFLLFHLTILPYSNAENMICNEIAKVTLKASFLDGKL